jgi:pimeloyl-ACP methyl ester carboxylesterase
VPEVPDGSALVQLHTLRRGSGPPLVLIHGLGSRATSWEPVLATLAAEREVIAVDLPGHGGSPALSTPPSVPALADALETWLYAEGLGDADLVGASLGARLVLELVRRGVGRHVVSLDPGGFWSRRELAWFRATLRPSVALVRALRPALPALAHSPVARTVLFAQLSARPWALDGAVVEHELASLVSTPAFDATYRALVDGPTQRGLPSGVARGRIVIAWGRSDKLTVPAQARRAAALFPDAELVWVERSGHYPHLDRPGATARLILESTGG